MWRMTKVVDNNGMQDQAADYKGEGGERAANNNGIRHKAGLISPTGREREKMKKSSLQVEVLLCRVTSYGTLSYIELYQVQTPLPQHNY